MSKGTEILDRDAGTFEIQPPRKRGRPPKHDSGAMTQAQRAQAYRRRRVSRLWDTECTYAEASDSRLLELLQDLIVRTPSDSARQKAGDVLRELNRRYP